MSCHVPHELGPIRIGEDGVKGPLALISQMLKPALESELSPFVTEYPLSTGLGDLDGVTTGPPYYIGECAELLVSTRSGKPKTRF